MDKEIPIEDWCDDVGEEEENGTWWVDVASSLSPCSYINNQPFFFKYNFIMSYLRSHLKHFFIHVNMPSDSTRKILAQALP